jgi:hypothetical protein
MNVSDERWNPLALFVFTNSVLPADWLSWETISVYRALEDMGFGKITEKNACKLNAVRTLRTSLLAWSEWEVFEKVGHGLFGFIPNFSQVEPLSLLQCAVTRHVMNAMKESPCAEEVLSYIAACAAKDEISYLPKPLEDAQIKLSPPMYECLDCGYKETADLEDGKCDRCVGRYKDQTALGQSNVNAAVGTNVAFHNSLPFVEVKKMYDALVSLPHNTFDLDMDATSIQVEKLLDIREALRYFDTEVKEQVRALPR